MCLLNAHWVVGDGKALLRIDGELPQHLFCVADLPYGHIHWPHWIERSVPELGQVHLPNRLVKLPSVVLYVTRFVGPEPSQVIVVAVSFDILWDFDKARIRSMEC